LPGDRPTRQRAPGSWSADHAARAPSLSA